MTKLSCVFLPMCFISIIIAYSFVIFVLEAKPSFEVADGVDTGFYFTEKDTKVFICNGEKIGECNENKT